MKAYITIITGLLGIICLSTVSAQTQKPWQWVAQLGGESLDQSGGIARDSKNNIYVTGSFFGTLKGLDSKVNSAGDKDIYLARFDQKGNLKDLWSGGGHKADNATCITITPADLIVVGGEINDTVSLCKIKDQKAGSRLFVSGITNKGKASWITTLSVLGSASFVSLCSDQEGNIVSLGSFTGQLKGDNQMITSAGKQDIFLATFTSAGQLKKLIGMGGEEDDIPGSLTVNAKGEVACSGQGGKDFMIGSYPVHGSVEKPRANAFLAYFNTTLTPMWVQNISGKEFCNISSLAFSNANLYAGGSFSFDINTGDTTFHSRGYSDIFLLKYNPEGKRIWGRSTGTWYYDYSFQVIPDPLGGAIVTGALGDTLQVDSLSLYPVSQKNAALILQFDSTGRAVWGDCISGQGRNFATGAITDSYGNLYMTGAFSENFEKEGSNLESHGGQDVFVAKYYNCSTNQAEIKGDPWVCPSQETTLSVKSGYRKVIWNDSIANRNYISIQKPGKYWVSMYDKKGCVLADTLVVSLPTVPYLGLGPDTSLWVCDSMIIKAPEGFVQYQWNDKSGRESYLVTAPDQKPGRYPYQLSVTDSLDCTWKDTIQVTFMSIPASVDISRAELVSYPNPVTDEVYWYLKTEAPVGLFVELVDENGRKYYVHRLENYMPGQVEKIDMQGLPIGSYHIRVKNPGNNTTVRTLSIIKR